MAKDNAPRSSRGVCFSSRFPGPSILGEIAVLLAPVVEVSPVTPWRFMNRGCPSQIPWSEAVLLFEKRESLRTKVLVGGYYAEISTRSLDIFLLLAAAACQTQDTSDPGSGRDNLVPLHSPPTSSASLDCRYTPSGIVEFPVGQTQTFSPSAGNCDGAFGTITPGDGRLGFGISSPCATFAKEETGAAHLFKIHRCLTGNGSFKIWTNSSQTTLLQTISLASK
jgi:hypothetical protein